MLLTEQIEQDLVAGLKTKDETCVSTLRMLKSALHNKEIATKKELDDTDVISVIQSQIKSRRDSVMMYEKGNRKELAEKENNEIAILQKYLPTQMSEDEIKAMVNKVITDTSASAISDMGKVMGVIMPRVKGKADPALISKIVKESLS